MSTTALHPDRDLDLAIATCTETNRLIAVADVKAGLVLAVQGALLAGLVTTSAGASPPVRSGALQVLIGVGFAILLLLGAVWPRLPAPVAPWFAVSVLRVDAGVAAPARPAVADLAQEAWVQAGVLAALARRKYRWFRAGVVLTAIDLVGFTVWTAGALL